VEDTRVHVDRLGGQGQDLPDAQAREEDQLAGRAPRWPERGDHALALLDAQARTLAASALDDGRRDRGDLLQRALPNGERERLPQDPDDERRVRPVAPGCDERGPELLNPAGVYLTDWELGSKPLEGPVQA
jgi:hypothetical protein